MVTKIKILVVLGGLVFVLLNTGWATGVEFRKLVAVYKTTCKLDIIGVKYGRREFSIATVKRFAVPYILLHVPTSSAKDWILTRCHSTKSGNLIYIKFKDGTLRPASSVLLEQLDIINKVGLIK